MEEDILDMEGLAIKQWYAYKKLKEKETTFGECEKICILNEIQKK